ncbi:MAG: hypothetical protein MK066_07570 [Crocinitomicaceae bacterium]|nr:hypothetical protein [Crocinitomicaceae bacterium]
MKYLNHVLAITSLLLVIMSCSKYKITPGNDPNFKIVKNEDQEFKKFQKKVTVFGIPIYATKKVENQKLLHAANIMAQYLDNDENDTIDNQLVVNKMIEKKAFLFMWKNKLERRKAPNVDGGQDLGANETIPSWHTNGQSGTFDASLEEVLHLITHVGYASVYPTVFGEGKGTALSNAMDIARGGQYTEIPSSYPSSAWYTYDDQTCNYNCMTTEYIYWSLTSILGAQTNRLSEISQEWKLNTKSLVEGTDSVVYGLLTDPQYKFPTVLPDGTYKH